MITFNRVLFTLAASLALAVATGHGEIFIAVAAPVMAYIAVIDTVMFAIIAALLLYLLLAWLAPRVKKPMPAPTTWRGLAYIPANVLRELQKTEDAQ